jgi:hypothetical protein
MSKKRIGKLTPEQEALIPVYGEKWRKIALSTEPIDREKAAEAVRLTYAAIRINEPKIRFFDSLNKGLEATIFCLLDSQINSKIERAFRDFEILILRQLSLNLRAFLGQEILNQTLSIKHFVFLLMNQLKNQIKKPTYPKLFDSYYWAYYGCYCDFCINVLNCTYDEKIWLAFQSLANYCGWILTFERFCFVCDRPRILSFDNQNRLHAEGAPAIQFADGYSLYAYHGIPLPEKYGKIHPNQWQASWLLEEQNAELRRVLIQGIGYSRIASELGAIELDSFQEYSLLKIDTDVDIEPIYMLKMICPSTGYIHVLRVPPNVNSAKEAIRWVNWGIDPEEFAVQT